MESQNHLLDAVDKHYITETTRLELNALAETALEEVTGLMEYLHTPEALRNARRARERRIATRQERRSNTEPEIANHGGETGSHEGGTGNHEAGNREPRSRNRARRITKRNAEPRSRNAEQRTGTAKPNAERGTAERRTPNVRTSNRT